MNPVSPYAALLALLVALCVTALLVKRVGVPPVSGRFAPLDGLRGYMALCVFIFHSAMWYSIVRTGQIEVPHSHLFAHFGQDSVLMFFMITGFLFWTKLINSKAQPIDWTRLYVSRVMRLVPLYLFAFCLMMLVVSALSGFHLHERPLALLQHSLVWLTFSFGGQPDLNGDSAARMMLGDNWSLPYEWFFYFSLPAGALLLRSKVSWVYALSGIVALAVFGEWATNTHMMLGFVGGITAAFAVRVDRLRRWATGRIGSAVVVAAVVVAVSVFSSGYSRAVFVLLTLAFTIIACGNSLFGVLTNAVSRTLGEISYSIYLLHSSLLFLTFKVVLGYSRAARLSPAEHWLIVFAVTALLMLLCAFTFRLIEKPAMDAAPRAHAWLMSRVLAPSSRVAATRP